METEYSLKKGESYFRTIIYRFAHIYQQSSSASKFRFRSDNPIVSTMQTPKVWWPHIYSHFQCHCRILPSDDIIFITCLAIQPPGPFTPRFSEVSISTPQKEVRNSLAVFVCRRNNICVARAILLITTSQDFCNLVGQYMQPSRSEEKRKKLVWRLLDIIDEQYGKTSGSCVCMGSRQWQYDLDKYGLTHESHVFH